jgi:hypothetical protein
VFEVDFLALLARDVLRERAAELIAEACAWSVGLSDQPHLLRRGGRLVATGVTMGVRAASGLPLSGEEDGRLELGDARPGSFQDALNALAPDGTVHAERFDAEVVEPFALATCVLAAERARQTRRAEWRDLLDDLGEDGGDLVDVVRAGEWEAPLRIDADHLVLAALGDVPLIAVVAAGLPLSLVRAAEAVTRSAAVPEPGPVPDGDLAGSLFLAEAALREAGVPVPVPPEEAERLLGALLAEGLLLEDVPAVLAHLPVQPATAREIDAIVAAAGLGW